MNFSALRLPSSNLNIVNSSSYSYTASYVTNNYTSNQIFDWVIINSTNVNIGEVYYFDSASLQYLIASTATDITAETIGIIEETMPQLGTGTTLGKLVYYGKLTFDQTAVTLSPGSPYFLNSTFVNSYYKTGPEPFRNLTTIEPMDVSKPLFVAISFYEAILVNYRGMLNTVPTQSYYNPESYWDCDCTNIEPPPSASVTPQIQIYINQQPPPQ